MSELVEFLSRGEHPLAMARYSGAAELRERIERGYVLVKFTDTRGGTELGVRLDPARCRLDGADFEHARGTVQLVGALTLDFVDIEVSATVDVGTLSGTGSVRALREAATAAH